MQPHSPLMKYHVNKNQARNNIPKGNILNVNFHLLQKPILQNYRMSYSNKLRLIGTD